MRLTTTIQNPYEEVIKEKIEKVKNHFLKHKMAYSCGATAVVSAGITYILMRRGGTDKPAMANVSYSFFFPDSKG